MDYKETLLLPKTDFPMRGNLPQNEPKRYAQWFSGDIYGKMKRLREGRELFTLHDGPPYANGDIHIGHALNKILKDIIVKHRYFQGDAVRFTPGWDCHGLPIEQKVEEKVGKAKKESMPVEAFRALCREHAATYVDIQRESFKKLGVIADWDHPYVTMDFAFEANIYRTLCDVAKKGLLVERHKPIYWSWAAQTALAEAEVEYKDKEDYSIYVHFELSDAAKEKLDIYGKAGIVIWTTTPWTLPANSGIALNPDEMYVLTDDGHIVAEKRYDALIEEGVVSGHASRKIAAVELENLLAINPLNGRSSRIVLGEHVMMDGGTGAVHTAPGHGEDDYKVGLKYALDVIMPVDEKGLYDESVVALNLLPEPDSFVGMHIFKANEKILELLGENLLKVSKFTHSYPHCWRTKKPLIFRATNQWFIAVDETPKGEQASLRRIALDALENVTFYPATARNRLTPMIEDRPDWCISRQRSWGVPIAFFRHKGTKKVILDDAVLEHIAAIFDEKGCDAWYAMGIEELLPEGCGYDANELEKVNDILDVWFDSGSTWYAVLASGRYDAGAYPASLYLEGSDQHRGWFQSSLLLSAAIKHQAPYRNLVTHGFTVDEKGEKMSKSRGNVVAPDKVMQQFGSEILRLWVALSDYQNDLKISDNILKQTAEQYRKMRNTFRFLLANIDDLDTPMPVDALGALDRWILRKAKAVFDEVQRDFGRFDFLRGFATLNHFITNELSGIYLDITKDRLYCEAQDAPVRRSVQTAMLHIAETMLGCVAPVLTYTADEVLRHAPAVLRRGREDIFELEYVAIPDVPEAFDDAVVLAAREAFYEAVDGLKKAKTIKSTLELAIVGNRVLLTIEDAKDLEDWFVVSQVCETSEGETLATFEVEGGTYRIVRADGAKCPRCWRYVAIDEQTPCERCAKVLA